jgi:FkbM family methyltransferase
LGDGHTPGDLAEIVDVSQHGEAGILAGLVEPDWPPYLVDVGAHDGRSLSNSFPFLELGWAGVLVEPLPRAFERLAQRYRGRTDVQCVQAACGDAEGEMPLFVGEDGPWTMNSTLCTDDTPHWRSVRGRTSVAVRVRTLTSVLDEADAPRDFSLLLVDAEGMDHEVLAGLDFARFRPRVIVTEDDLANPQKHDAKNRLLTEAGYVLYTIVAATNSIWVSSAVAPEAHARGPGPLLSPEEAARTVTRSALERRCAELERSRDEIWAELMVIQASRSWRLTRPLRDMGRKVRSLRRGAAGP